MRSLLIFLTLITMVVKSAQAAPDININGSISQTYVKSMKNNWEPIKGSADGSFDFSEVLLGFSADLTDQLRAGAQLISRDFGEEDNFRTYLDWGYGDYRLNEFFGLRAGKVKYPLGFYNESRDIDSARLGILLSQAAYREDFRSFVTAVEGVNFYGVLESPTHNWGALDYTLTYGTLNFPDSFIINQGLSEFSPGASVQADHLYGFTLTWHTPLEGLKLGYTFSDLEAESDMVNAFGPGIGESAYAYSLHVETVLYGFEYTKQKWTFGGEVGHQILSSQYSNGISQAYEQAIPFVDETVQTAIGGILHYLKLTNEDREYYYLYTSYEWTNDFSSQIMYSNLELKEDKRDDSAHRGLTLSMRYDFNDYMIGKLEYHDIKGTDAATPKDTGTPVDNHWGMFLTRLSFSF
ncbi:MAG: hypothetical protein HQL32_14350 [Planctomycetes bacterium]|nr:hypothetical protein [Planctomycetota bacterium]